MYSYEQRTKAVKLLIQYDMSYAAVIRELGYPTDSHSLRNWYKEYMENGDLHSKFQIDGKYSEKEKRKAVDYYLEHGRCVSRACKKLGYPSRPILSQWIDELAPDQRKRCQSSGSVLKYTREQKEQAVIALCSREKPAREIAEEYGTTRENLYNWKRQLLTKELEKPVKRKNQTKTNLQTDEVSALREEVSELKNNISALEEERTILEQEVYRLRMERDIYEKAAELIKKDQGISIQHLTNREKAIVINALRERYPLKDLLVILQMAKSSYCYQATALKTDKYAQLREQIRHIFSDARSRYGYRRIHAMLKASECAVSEKVVRRIMREEQLVVPNVKRKKYSSYKGEISPAVPNIINRDFHADKPNEKWLTDITEFHIPAGKVYLSPIIDCFDGLPVSWTIGTNPDAELVNTMLDEAIATLGSGETPVIHSDRGCHYRWPGWIERMEKAGLTRSMSKKGCSPDNSACEGLFGRLKNEMFYGVSWKDIPIEQFIEEVDSYMRWYAEERIKLSLGGMSPVNYRKSLGLLPT